jgi:hypothetical protein
MYPTLLLHCFILILIVEGIVAATVEKEVEKEQQQSLRHRRLTSESERPSIHTYYEQSDSYDPTDDTLDLLENWRKNWYDMGKFVMSLLCCIRLLSCLC